MDGFEDSTDYVWHFKLPESASRDGGHEAMSEMVKRQVEALLRCVVFTSNSDVVRVTGFRFLDQPDVEHVLEEGFGKRPRKRGVDDSGGIGSGEPHDGGEG
jgi:hypothetical protein